MCLMFEKARVVTLGYLTKHRVVKVADLVEKVREIAGTTRVGPGRTVLDYLEDLEQLGYVERRGWGVYISKIHTK